eukprot:749744-Pleurochrysis_carterae.AAC.1
MCTIKAIPLARRACLHRGLPTRPRAYLLCPWRTLTRWRTRAASICSADVHSALSAAACRRGLSGPSALRSAFTVLVAAGFARFRNGLRFE